VRERQLGRVFGAALVGGECFVQAGEGRQIGY